MMKIKEEIIKNLNILAKRTANKDITELHLITGMALGIDTLFAEVAIEHGIFFTAAIPCHDQEKKWPIESQRRYNAILHNPLCQRVLVSDVPYDQGVMQIRNEWMVNNCDLLIAIWDGTFGGTYNCRQYAIVKGKPVVTINPKSL